MKKIISLLCAALFLMAGLSNVYAQDKQLTAVFSYGTFYQSGIGSYVETYLSFDAWNLNFVKTGDTYQAKVEVIITVSKDDSIELVKKYDLNSPRINSPELDHFNFLDMQRFSVANGLHNLRIQLRDMNSDNAPTIVEQQLALYYTHRRPALSSLMMVASVRPTATENILSRGGYDIEPYVNDFVPEQIKQIDYYYELYNIDNETRDEHLYAVAHVEIQETGRILEATQTIRRIDNDSIIPIFGSIDIAALPSGNYNLVVEIRNKKNELLLFKKLPFFRSNPTAQQQAEALPTNMTFAAKLTDEQELNNYIEALAPIANDAEKRDIYSIIHRPGLEEKQTFMYKFWVRRDPLNADGAWREYKERVDYVNKNFSWPKTKGIQTDRGRVYLQYGPPDYVRDEKNFVSAKYIGGGVNIHQQSSDPYQQAAEIQGPNVNKQGQIFYLPYQLWRYNHIMGDDQNRCFIFWDEFRSGFYKLLHSNAKGEVRDMLWERRLSQGQLPEDMTGEVGEQFNRGH